MEKLDTLLHGSLQRHHLDDHYTASAVLATCKEYINTKMPRAAAAAITPSVFQHGVIFLRVRNNSAAQEFRFYEQHILDNIQAAHPKENIRRFAFKIQTSLESDVDEVAE